MTFLKSVRKMGGIVFFVLLTAHTAAFAKCEPEELENLARSPRTPQEWSRYNQHRLNTSFNNLLPEFIRQYHSGNKVLLNFLDRASGFTLMKKINEQTQEKLSSAQPEEYKYAVQLPSLEQIIDYYNKQVDQLVAKGLVPGGSQNAIKAGRTFRPVTELLLQNKANLEVRLWTNEFNPDTFQPYSGNANSPIYDHVLGNLGLFMVSDAEVDLWRGMPQSLHDLAHLASLLEYPKMMAAWRDFSRTLANDRERATLFAKTKVSDPQIPSFETDELGAKITGVDGNPVIKRDENGNPVPKSYSLAFVRGVMSFEYMSRVSDVTPFKPLLLLPETSSPFLTVAAVEAHLKKYSLKQKIDAIRDIYKTFQSHAEYIGGATVDVIGNEAARGAFMPGFEISMHRFMSLALNTAARVRQGKTTENHFDHALARLQVALVEFHKLDAPAWVNELKEPRLAENSPLRKIICETGLYAPQSYIYGAICL